MSVSDAEVSEDGGYVTFAVSLSQPSRGWVSVQFAPSDGTATGGTDFDARAGWVLFFPNSSEITRHVRVAVHDDQEVEPDETFTFTLTSARGATLGDATATGTIKDDDTVAAGVTVVSDPGGDATYAAGDTVRVAVTFSEAVEVDTGDGTPRLKLDLGGDDGAGERWAAYEDGSGTDTLTFVWTAAAPDESAVGVAVLADTLESNGGRSARRRRRPTRRSGHPGRDHDPAHKVDAAPPQLLRGEIDGGKMTLWFSEPLDPDWTGGRFDMGLQNPEGGVGFRATGDVTVEGNTVTVGMGAGRPRAQAGLKGNSVIYRRLADGSDGPLRDLAGNRC